MSHAVADGGGSWRTAASRYALLPLRVFLGVTFIYAGLDKLSDPNFFSDSGTGSLLVTLNGAKQTAAIPGMIDLALKNPDAFGYAISFGELAVGVGALFGLWTRLAAAGGALLSLSLWLTVSWQVEPYYLGNDLAYLMAWLPLVIAGAPVFSVDAAIAGRRQRLEQTGARPGDVRRRFVLDSGLAAVAVGVVGGIGGGLATWRGRRNDSKEPAARPSDTGGPGSSGSDGGTGGGGKASVAVSSVPVGQGAKVTDPKSGKPAFIVQPEQDKFVAFSAICTHQGCTVEPPKDGKFVCPCHSSEFDAATGKVLKGPATSPLKEIGVRTAGERVELL